MSPMDVFRLRDAVIQDYAEYVRSFVQIRDRRIDNFVETNDPLSRNIRIDDSQLYAFLDFLVIPC